MTWLKLLNGATFGRKAERPIVVVAIRPHGPGKNPARKSTSRAFAQRTLAQSLETPWKTGREFPGWPILPLIPGHFNLCKLSRIGFGTKLRPPNELLYSSVSPQTPKRCNRTFKGRPRLRVLPPTRCIGDLGLSRILRLENIFSMPMRRRGAAMPFCRGMQQRNCLAKNKVAYTLHRVG